MGFNRFQNRAAQLDKLAANAAPPRLFSGGTQAADNKFPLPQVGSYRLRVVETYVTSNPRSGGWFHADFEVVDTSNHEAHPIGSKVSYLQGFTGKSEAVGKPKIKRFCMVAVGCEEQAEYDAWDPQEDLPNAACGEANAFGEQPLAGRILDAEVARGKDKPGGTDWFRDWSFLIVQDQDEFADPRDAAAQ